MLVKIVRFIKNKYFNIKKSVKTYDERIKQLDYDDLKNIRHSRNPYQVFFDWVLFEVLQYGVLVTLSFAIIFLCSGWVRFVLLPITFGVIRWLWLDFVANTSKAIRNKE